ncbi:MAG: hypothetical protein CMI52_04105 [Parcubacteria group bacterium]|nr:hypothetical protein [Parcubacteria group bacterium]|tara:strand:+ start:235 stop:597 length:363 start_codon:yes stop_codon:yes gene_type:complete
MLDQNDKTEIRTIVTEVIDGVVREAILPGFASVESRLDGVESRLDGVESRLDRVERKITTMPDRDDLDRATADIKGSLNEKLRKQQNQIGLLLDYLKDANVLKDSQIIELRKFDLFPSMQ